MIDENEIDNEANNIDLNGKIENYHQPPLSKNDHLIDIHMFIFLLEMIIETSTHSTIERNIYNVLRKHFLEQRSITWKPIKVELIINTQLNR